MDDEGAEERGLPGPKAVTVTSDNRVDSGRCRTIVLDRIQLQRCRCADGSQRETNPCV